MILRLLTLLLIAWTGLAVARELSPVELMERDKAQCSQQASTKYTWILNMTKWREAYNHCLREKLRSLNPRYIKMTLEAIRLEEECPEYLLNHTPVELSTLGFEIVNHLTPKEMQKGSTSNNIEQHLLLYYERLKMSRNRVRELRGRQP